MVRKGLSYKGEYIHQQGPALLGIGTIKEGGGFRPENVRYYGGPYKEQHVLKPGDVYIALTSQDGFLIGSPAMVPKDFKGIGITTHHDAKIDWKTDDQVMRDFLYWVMHSFQFIQHCQNFSVGTTVYSTRGKDVERFLVPRILTSRQVLATKALNFISTEIDNIEKKSQNLESQIEALFRSWFIDFDPVKAKAKGKLPYGMDEETAALFPETFKDSDFGLIPYGWNIGILSNIAKITMGTSPPGDTYCNLDSASLPLLNGAGDFKGHKLMPKQGTTEPTKIANIGDFVFCIRATIGNLSVCNEQYCIGRGVASARENKRHDRGFLQQTISHLFRVWEWEATGSVIKGITGPEVKDAKIILPPKEIREKFQAAVGDSILKLQKNLELETCLKDIKETLLSRLVYD